MITITVPVFALIIALVLIGLFFTLPRNHQLRNLTGIGAGIACFATVITL